MLVSKVHMSMIYFGEILYLLMKSNIISSEA